MIMKTTNQRFCRTTNRAVIGKMVFPTLLLLLFSFKTTEYAGGLKFPVIRKAIKIESAFENIRVDGDITIVLTNEPAGRLIIEGKESDVKKIRHTLKNNLLIVDAKRKNSFEILTVYVPVTMLKYNKVNGDADISSIGIINAPDLCISLNGKSTVKVQVTGRLRLDTPDDYDLLWELPLLANSK